MGKRILFISTDNLTCTPRILKEVKLAMRSYDVEFVGFSLGNWSDEAEKKILGDLHGLQFHYLSAERTPFVPWLLSTAIQSLARLFWRILPHNLLITALASTKRTWLLLQYLKTLRCKEYDLIVAHTLGALYPAFCLAQQTRTKVAFDVEDYDPGVVFLGGNQKNEKKRREFLNQKLLPQCTYVSYASPLIGRYALELVTNQKIRKHLLINNCFSAEEFVAPNESPTSGRDAGKVRFVWFSQNISCGRGLELIIPSLSFFKQKVSLTLIGNLSPEFSKAWVKPHEEFIQVLSPMRQPDLHRALSQHDVGLAIELNHADLNRNLALTNKIFAYYQAGLFILATNTPAQEVFLREHNKSGFIVEQNAEAMSDGIQKILGGIQNIRDQKMQRYEAAKNVSWEIEAEKLLSAWEEIVR